MTMISTWMLPRVFLLSLAAVLGAGPALAHGDAKHGAAKGEVRKEQKPWGIAGEPRAATRTLTVVMSDDMRFTPDRLEFKQGETVRLVIRNAGRLMHEFVLGTKAELDEHAAMMVRFPDMEHDEPYMAHVPPGETGEIVWTFNRAGEFHFACLIPGHYQAGMVGKAIVLASKEK